MYRHLLAFFALLSGFLAYGEPVEARALSEAAAQLQQNEASPETTQTASLPAELLTRIDAIDGRMATGPWLRVALPYAAPTVRVGIDRAYE